MLQKVRIDAFGALHHIIAKGINRRKIFFDDADRDDFLDGLGGIRLRNARTMDERGRDIKKTEHRVHDGWRIRDEQRHAGRI